METVLWNTWGLHPLDKGECPGKEREEQDGVKDEHVHDDCDEEEAGEGGDRCDDTEGAELDQAGRGDECHEAAKGGYEAGVHFA